MGEVLQQIDPSHNTKSGNIFRFDTGPSLFTMPFVLDELFQFAGRERSDLLTFEPINPLCRYFFPDGSRLDAVSNLEQMCDQIEQIAPGQAKAYRNYLSYSERIYRLTADVFLHRPIHEWRKLLDWRLLPSLLRLPQIDPFRTVHGANAGFFSDARLVQLFDRYATYNGSNPFVAPATLNIIPYVEYVLGGYYIKGGIYRLTEALVKLAQENEVEIVTGVHVSEILHNHINVTGIKTRGEKIAADFVLCGADVVETYRSLLTDFPRYCARLDKLEPSLSGMVFLWSVVGEQPNLAQHNIIFSKDYESEFSQIFWEKRDPDDPTIYIAITSKNDPDHAPSGCENWFVLLNMPYLAPKQNWQEAKDRMRAIVLEKLQKLNLLQQDRIIAETCYTPMDFYELYRSNRGSIYGISSNSRSMAFRRPPNRDRNLAGLYFSGGSVHPGGGVPLVLLSGKIASGLIAEHAGIGHPYNY